MLKQVSALVSFCVLEAAREKQQAVKVAECFFRSVCLRAILVRSSCGKGEVKLARIDFP